MTTDEKPRRTLTQEDLMSRFGVLSPRSVQRIRKEFGLLPAKFQGFKTPLFAIADVERVEKLRQQKQFARLAGHAAGAIAGAGPGIFTIRQAKRQAKGKR